MADKNAFFRESTLRICGSLDISTALQDFHDYVKTFIPATAASLNIYNQDAGAVIQMAHSMGDFADMESTVVPLHSGHEEAVSLLEGKRYRNKISIINDVSHYEIIEKLFRQVGLPLDASYLILILELDEVHLGELWLGVRGRNAYTTSHADLLLTVQKPVSIAMSNALIHGNLLNRSNKLADELAFLRQEMNQHLTGEVLGSQHGLKTVMDHVTQVAAMDSPVLIMGETGAGKEVIANAIHRMSGRFDQPLVKVNCGAIPSELIDSELFGHEKGAFTGALRRKAGRFERANSGTLFLDEVGELPPKAQVRLLRVLQEHEIERVGGSETIPVDVRVISATNKNLPDMVTRGRFREDLWYRLNVYPILIPPLRERTVDIPDLAQHFLEQKATELNLSGVPALSSKALDQLVKYHWPGNVRELQNVIERALIHFGNRPLDFSEILNIAPAGNVTSLRHSADEPTSFEEMSRRHILRVLSLCDGKISGSGGAAEKLDLHPNTLRNKMLKLGIPFPGREKGN